LYGGLAAELEPLLRTPLHFPTQKALLSREGGRCADDGTTLDFDPYSPRQHRCPKCGTVFTGDLHDRAWITWYQLWLAERAVHAALFHALRGEARHRDLAASILGACADQYLAYPNVDNVLGPTRPFFSTYLESIWLLQVCVATVLLGDAAGDLAGRVRDRVVEPSRRLIGEFDEGMSNRQVWNNAAMLAAASICDDPGAASSAIHGTSGLLAHLDEALLEDGSWYEGENYHQFALRGLWYGVTLAENGGFELPRELRDRFHRAFAIPFLTALPDFTMPSRKDSQYAVSLRQWRLAELTELGFARTGDAMLRAGLARCYEPGHPRGQTGRDRSAAEAERNTPSGGLTREDLSWRALAFAVPELPRARAVSPRSVHLPAQGYAVFRRAPDVYVGFEYGQSGGGHGHPDRLNLTLCEGHARWLDDLGTGSYVDPSLHWYRSTLAHNAPLVNGQSQNLVGGVLEAYEEREGMGWVAAALGAAPNGANVRRAVVVATDYLVDELSWSSDDATVRIDLPLHLHGRANVELRPGRFPGGNGIEDGFDFVTDVREARIRAGQLVRLDCERDGRALSVHMACTADATLFDVSAPGQPSTEARRFIVIRAEGTAGRIRSVIAWAPSVQVSFDDDVHVSTAPDERHVHRRGASRWHVELHAGGARSSIDLDGFVPSANASIVPPNPSRDVVDIRRGANVEIELGREHYRRSEQEWDEAGSPRATVTLARDGDALVVSIASRAGDPQFAAASATNTFDNEHPDTMGAGVQLYLRSEDRCGAWSLVPEPEAPDHAVRVRNIEVPRGFESLKATWRAREEDYVIVATVPMPPGVLEGRPFDMDIYVNETIAGRSRRRGQLVLSGARGEWVYLRGDRHAPDRWRSFRFA
jgi:hypothetical protein